MSANSCVRTRYLPYEGGGGMPAGGPPLDTAVGGAAIIPNPPVPVPYTPLGIPT